jgi:hypothetical protein
MDEVEIRPRCEFISFDASGVRNFVKDKEELI